MVRRQLLSCNKSISVSYVINVCSAFQSFLVAKMFWLSDLKCCVVLSFRFPQLYFVENHRVHFYVFLSDKSRKDSFSMAVVSSRRSIGIAPHLHSVDKSN